MSEDIDDKLRESCGVFGISCHPDAAELTILGLHALQHRGQEAVGIVSVDGNKFKAERKVGLVGDHFSKKHVVQHLKGASAIGHVRYSTTGEPALRNIQPMYADFSGGGFSIAHNGNFTNSAKLRHELIHDGAIFQSSNDTECLIHLTARAPYKKLMDRFIHALFRIEGAYSLVALTSKKLIAVRDPFGLRPLLLGKFGNAYVVCSETVALDIIGASFVRDIDPGEIVVIEHNGCLESIKPFKQTDSRICLFEYIYFSRPDSILNGKSVYMVRKDLGKQLAIESSVEADVVVPIPDSGVPMALGFARQIDIPFELGLIRNHYVGRTFIEPTQYIRQLGVKLKHNANKAVLNNKRVILVDDSIVRGTTAKKIVQFVREAGATEVHMRIASPPIRYPDFYGINIPYQNELIAFKHSVEEIREMINVDSLSFLSIDGLYKVMNLTDGKNSLAKGFSDHCFTGNYPTHVNLDISEQKSNSNMVDILQNETMNESPINIKD